MVAAIFLTFSLTTLQTAELISSRMVSLWLFHGAAISNRMFFSFLRMARARPAR